MSVPEKRSVVLIIMMHLLANYTETKLIVHNFPSVSKRNEDMQFLFFFKISFRFMLRQADNAISEAYNVIYINGPVYHCL